MRRGGTVVLAVDTDKWYSPEEIAEMMHINVQTVRRAIRARKLAAKKFGKLWRISDASLQAYMKDSADEEAARLPDEMQ
jgi:excisionase family DNA binding protein